MAKKTLTFIWLALLAFLFLAAFRSVSGGFIPFWYDPARDLLQALDNLKKLTLIGPPTGIPGIFYLPYWTWFLSLPLLFTRDPRWITLFTTTLPYYLLLPLLFFLLKDTFGKLTSMALCLLFFLSYENLTVQLWSPNLQPLLLLGLIYLVIIKRNFLAGLTVGISLGFNMAFGIVATTATVLFYFFGIFRKSWRDFIFAMTGLGLTLTPYFVFEFRHGFNQTKMYLAAFGGHSGVILAGLSQEEIISRIVSIPQQLLHLPNLLIGGLLVLTLLLLGYRFYTHKIKLAVPEKRLWFFLLCCFISLSYIYFVSKNPKWDYHFIGLEILVLLVIGLIVKYTRLAWLLILWTLVLFVSHALTIINPPNYKLEQNNLVEKEKVVTKIYDDVGSKPFAVYPYNQAIYTYDFDYLFAWLGKDKYRNVPVSQGKTNVVYLIFPPTKQAVIDDFINYKTPENQYITINTWPMPDGTLVVKRTKTTPLEEKQLK